MLSVKRIYRYYKQVPWGGGRADGDGCVERVRIRVVGSCVRGARRAPRPRRRPTCATPALSTLSHSSAQYNYTGTTIMAASFRNAGEIRELAG